MGFVVSQPNQSTGSLNALVAQTDQLEPGLATLQSLASAEGADVALIQSATANLLLVLSGFNADTAINFNLVVGLLTNLEILLTQVYGSSTNIDAAVTAMELRSRPLVWVSTDAWDPNNGDYSVGLDPIRRGVRVSNNTGDSLGRGAASLFIAYNGDVPDRITHVQFIQPGQSEFIDCPSQEFRIHPEGTGGLAGFFTIARFE